MKTPHEKCVLFQSLFWQMCHFLVGSTTTFGHHKRLSQTLARNPTAYRVKVSRDKLKIILLCYLCAPTYFTGHLKRVRSQEADNGRPSSIRGQRFRGNAAVSR